MKKSALTTLIIVVSASLPVRADQSVWASGAVDEETPDVIETVVLHGEDEPTVSEISRDDEDPIETVQTFFKASPRPIYFSIDPKTVRIAHGTAVTWLGCSSQGLVKGGYASDKKCGKALFQKTFEGQMNKMFFLCAERGANKANLAQPQRVFINHDGSYNNRTARNSKRLSMHAYARALDIANFNLIDAAGKVTKISTNVRNFRGATKAFYNEFRQCWKDAMPKSCRTGMTEHKGSIGIPSSALGGNKLHNDHIHLSYAPCAG